MQRLAMDLRVLSRELALYLEHQVRVGFFGSGVGLSLILGFSVAYACYYLSSIAKKPQLVIGGESFSRFLQDHCPVVTETYYPTVWCWESRGQTLLRPFITSKPPVQYRNELIKTADGGQISLDWFDNNNSAYYVDASTRPTILLLPGLTGTSKESYILHMIHLSEELGYSSGDSAVPLNILPEQFSVSCTVPSYWPLASLLMDQNPIGNQELQHLDTQSQSISIHLQHLIFAVQ
ncbi:phospholipase ABHD3 isoform X3 [Mus musculus]|uniref:phospholipase ABHD3 isoform X3 n=1 Tax=Mus musculus TaxID=10090 RepID=UPI0005AB9D5A|nr:phospholipase ABHD3 isoform X3 [Mus musculus]|eukprot:XP_011245096.1 PREDICTED: phospholipase ABHD3 isoform X2 [Mus musculus]